MKFTVALFFAFLAPAAAFVPPISCRGAITASCTHQNDLRAKGDDDDDDDYGGEGVYIPEEQVAILCDPEAEAPPGTYSSAPTFQEFLKFKRAERKETELKLPKQR